MKKYCHNCNEVTEYVVTKEQQNINVKGTPFNLKLYISRCKVCGEEVFVKENEIKNDKIMFDAYEKNKTPERGYYIRTNEYKSAVINDVFEELLFMKEFYGNKLNKDLSKDAIVLKNAINIVWEELLLHTNIDILVKDKKGDI